MLPPLGRLGLTRSLRWPWEEGAKLQTRSWRAHLSQAPPEELTVHPLLARWHSVHERHVFEDMAQRGVEVAAAARRHGRGSSADGGRCLGGRGCSAGLAVAVVLRRAGQLGGGV